MLLLILSFSPEFNNYLYYQNITQVYEKYENFIVRNLYIGNVYLGTDTIIGGGRGADILFINAYRHSIATAFSENLRKQLSSMEGIIPDIELPIKLPGALKQIIGEGGTIKVSGYQTVSLEVTQKVQEGVINGSFLDIKPDEDLNITINGIVGQKIHVDVNYNVKSLDESQNKVRVYYKSNDEDDIIQNINLGDTDKKGRFGITLSGKIANTDFNLQVTRVKSLPEEKTSEFSSQIESLTVFDYDYVKDRFYYIPMGMNDSLVLLRVYYQMPYSVTTIPARTFKVDGSTGDVANFELREEGEEGDYRVRYFQYYYGLQRPFLEIVNPPDPGRMIAIYYITKDITTGEFDTVGYLTESPTDTSSLLLIRSSNPTPEDTTWYLMMRNVYSFPTSGEGITDFSVDIYRVVPGGEPVNFDENTNTQYIKILGLDQDTVPGIDAEKFVDFQNGYIFFPYAYPFLIPDLAPDTVPAIYRKLYPENDEKNKYFLVIKYKAPLTRFTIGGGKNIVENSEVIIVDGDTLKRDIDYTIDYATGEVKIKDPKRFPPDAKVSYIYQVMPFGGLTFSQDYLTKLETKTRINNRTFLNTSIDFNASSVSDFYPRLGSEPANFLLGKASFKTGLDLDLLLPLISRLPIIGSEKTPVFNLSGNVSLSVPNPSSRGKGYVDDMENTTRSEPFGNTIREWSFSSTPDGENEYLLGEIHWWSVNLMESDIFPSISGENNNIGAMTLYFIPRDNDPNSWGGIIYSFGSTARDMSKDQAIEMWVKADSGVLHIDIGSDISEDAPRLNADGEVIPANGIMDNEDVNRSGRLETGEDVGLDGVAYPDSLYYDGGKDAGDDGNDDYLSESPRTFEDTLKMNGTEGNKRIDTEDINFDDIFNLNNNYYSFRINLKDDRYVVATGKNGWKKIRILLEDSNIERIVGSPSWTNIRYVRVWINGVSGPTKIMVTKWGVVGSVWRNDGIEPFAGDSVQTFENFIIGYRSANEDSQYVPPVERERTSYGGYEDEKSLEIYTDSLMPGHIAWAGEYFDQPKDFRNYQKLVFFSRREMTRDVKIIFRFGTDTLNYYEFEKTLTTSRWDTITLDLSELTGLKIGDSAPEGYSVKGNPTLKQVYFIKLGVENVDTMPITGSVLFDDIYLSDPLRKPDIKYSYRVDGNLGENITYSVNESYQGEFYKGSKSALRNPGENRIQNRTYNVNVNLSRLTGGLLKLPVKYNLSINRTIPYYYRNSDIPLPDSLRERESVMERSENGTFSLSPTGKISHPVFKYILSGLNLSGSVRRKKAYRPYLSADTLISMNLSGGYNPKIPQWKIFFFSPLPRRISLSANYNFSTENKYQYNNSDSVFVKQDIKDIKKLEGTFSTSFNPLSFLSIDYTRRMRYDRTVPFDRRYGWLNFTSENLSAQVNLSIFKIDRASFKYATAYSENKDYQFSTSFGDSVRVRKAGVTREISTGHNITIDRFMKKLPIINLLTKNWSPLNLRLSHSVSNIYNYLSGSPDYRFRFGYDIYIPDDLVFMPSQTDGGKKRLQGSASTGFSVWKISANVSASRTEEYPIGNTATQKFIKMTLPQVNLKTSALGDILRKTGFIKTANLNLSLTRDTTFTLFLNDTTRKKFTSSVRTSPSLDLTLKNNMRLNIKGGVNQVKTIDVQGNTEIVTSSEDWNVSFSTSYSIFPRTGIRLPFMKRKLNLKSALNMKLSGTLKGKRDEVINRSTNQIDVRTDYIDGEFSLSGTYNLSKSMDITLGSKYTRHINRKLDTDRRHSFGMNISAKLKF